MEHTEHVLIRTGADTGERLTSSMRLQAHTTSTAARGLQGLAAQAPAPETAQCAGCLSFRLP